MNKNYLTKFFAFLGLLLAANGLLCWYTDPYAIFHTAKLNPPSPYATELMYYLRVTKAYQLEYLKPDDLIIGSSRAAILTPAKLDRPNEVAYNAALPGITSYEMWRYLRHAITIQKPKRIIIGLDYESFLIDDDKFLIRFEQHRLADNADDLRPLQSFARHYPDYWASLASANATTKALATLLKFNSGNIFLSDGTWSERREPGQLLLIGRPGYNFIAKQYFQRYADKRTTYSLEYLQRILDECYRLNIEVILYISPAHNLISTVYQYAHHYDARQQWQRDTTQLIEDLARSHQATPYPLWGFEDNNIVADDPERGLTTEGAVFRDGLHFSVEFGDAILRQVTASGPDNLGTSLTGATIDAYLAKTAANLTNYQQQHPDEMERLRKNLGL